MQSSSRVEGLFGRKLVPGISDWMDCSWSGLIFHNSLDCIAAYKKLHSCQCSNAILKKGSSSVWWRTRGIYCCYITLRARRVIELSHQIIAFSLARYLSNYSAVNLITSSPSFSAKSITRVKKKKHTAKKIYIFARRAELLGARNALHLAPRVSRGALPSIHFFAETRATVN